MTSKIELGLTADPAEAQRARTRAREQLLAWQLDGLVPAVEMLVSELVTNAVLHTGEPILFRLVYDTVLRVEVSDALPTAPELSHPGPADTAGRGLHLVTFFADRWDWYLHHAGKTVWCELEMHPGHDPMPFPGLSLPVPA